MMGIQLKPKIKADLAIIDSQFPQKKPFGFRNTEINELLRLYANVSSFAMFPMKPGDQAWFKHGYGVEKKVFLENLKSYGETYPQNIGRIRLLDEKRKYKFKLGYSFFLSETYVLLPFYEEHSIPFVFELYPGGAFGIDNESSDAMLKEIFSSKLFRGVVVTQVLTKNYLIKKKLCDSNKIHFIFGGFPQYEKSDVRKKQHFPHQKNTFDICLVAGKYSEGGVDKGYDIFVEVAKKLTKSCPNARFHIVGGFDETDYPLGLAASKFTFYGYQTPDFLADLYAKMDISLSPNRPGVLYKGNFDGFPLTLDSMFCGVGAFLPDDLKLNKGYFRDESDIVITGHDPTKIAKKIQTYYNDTEKLYKLSRKGQQRAQQLFSKQAQLKKRLEVFEKFVTLKARL